jgi:hypothetical protein
MSKDILFAYSLDFLGPDWDLSKGSVEEAKTPGKVSLPDSSLISQSKEEIEKYTIAEDLTTLDKSKAFLAGSLPLQHGWVWAQLKLLIEDHGLDGAKSVLPSLQVRDVSDSLTF